MASIETFPNVGSTCRISLEILDGVIESALEMDFLIETPTKAFNWNKAKAEPKGKTVVQPFNAGRVPPGMAKLMKCKRKFVALTL